MSDKRKHDTPKKAKLKKFSKILNEAVDGWGECPNAAAAGAEWMLLNMGLPIIELKPCLFCGRTKPTMEREFLNGKPSKYYVQCLRCRTRGPQSIHEKKATNAWNRPKR